MNIKKQLSKILVYVEHIEEENHFMDVEIAKYENQHNHLVKAFDENKRLSERIAELNSEPKYTAMSFEGRWIEFKDLVAENRRLADELEEYKFVAHDFVEINQPDHICRMRFKALLKKDNQQGKDGE